MGGRGGQELKAGRRTRGQMLGKKKKTEAGCEQGRIKEDF